MMQFLYKITPARLEMVTIEPTSEEAVILSRHFDYLKSLTDNGTVLLLGARRTPMQPLLALQSSAQSQRTKPDPL